MLELDGVHKRFASPDGEVVRAVDGITLTVEPGEVVALYGPSGAGKTTLLKLIAALLRPDAGAIRVGGEDVTGLTRRKAADLRRKRIGFVQQAPVFVPGANAIDNAALKLLDDCHRRAARKRVEPLMLRLGLEGRLKHRPDQLSTGEQQRVMIARALAINPTLLLADEPTGNLDSRRSHDVLGLLREVAREQRAATLLVTHDPQASAHADRALELLDGRLRAYTAHHATTP